jgi:MFS family permease
MVDVVDVRRDTPAPEPFRAAVPSAWAPLRHTWFRALWIAQFVANTGTWAQTVGAQWLMGDLGGSALQIALVQTAATLPVFLLVVPAGALGDILDRRRLLLLSQTLMLLASAALAVLTAAGGVTPNRLLALTAVLAIGQALAAPSFQAVQPELVPREELSLAALLNGANANVARAVGPAIGGLLVAASGPAAAFALNSASFLGVLAVLYRWPRPATRRLLGAEPIGQASRQTCEPCRSPASATPRSSTSSTSPSRKPIRASSSTTSRQPASTTRTSTTACPRTYLSGVGFFCGLGSGVGMHVAMLRPAARHGLRGGGRAAGPRLWGRAQCDQRLRQVVHDHGVGTRGHQQPGQRDLRAPDQQLPAAAVEQ